MANSTQYEKFHENTHFQKKIIKENNFTYRHILKIINKYVTSSKKILDIGCGAGTLCLYLAQKNNRVLGIDISEKAIESAKKSAKFLRLENVEFKKCDFPEDVPKEMFDVVIFTEVIEHIREDDKALKKIFSLLQPDGIAIITTPSSNAPLYKLGLAKEFDQRVGHLRRYTVESLGQKAENTGFTIIEWRKIEGILRNFLFLNPIAGKFIRYIKYFISDLITFIDDVLVKMFGESNIIIVLQKKK